MGSLVSPAMVATTETQERDQAASVALAGAMVVLGGRTPLEGELSNELEMWNSTLDTWQPLPHLAMEEARFSFCATPLNDTALMVLGGWGVDGALDSVQFLILQLAVGKMDPLFLLQGMGTLAS